MSVLESLGRQLLIETPLIVWQKIETREILLETDALFLPPYPECKINHPWNLEVVAQEVSRLRNVPLSMLMTAINQNTIQFYGLDSKR